MGILNFLKSPDIRQGIEDFRARDDAILLDVRTPQEYREGHIPKAKNVPLDSMDGMPALVERKDIPMFVYCYSGARSRQAVRRLQHMGYVNAKNIGGIAAYTGRLER